MELFTSACQLSRSADATAYSKRITSPELENLFAQSSPSTVLYNLEVIDKSLPLFTLLTLCVLIVSQLAHSMLMPANVSTFEKLSDVQFGFVQKGGLTLLMKLLSSFDFLISADYPTKR